MALAFDAGDAFAIDKPAGVPCPNLVGHQCKIHSDLSRRGFQGCIAYACAGSGQHTVALYDGRSWQDDPDLLPAQMETFRHLNRLHNLMELLTAAATLPLPNEIESKRKDLLARLAPDDMTPNQAQSLATGPLPVEINTFLRSLASYAPTRP